MSIPQIARFRHHAKIERSHEPILKKGSKMQRQTRRQRLETAAIVVGYAMSRFDAAYLASRGLTSWRACFEEAGRAMRKPPATFKNLRDEFDPIHANSRQGW